MGRGLIAKVSQAGALRRAVSSSILAAMSALTLAAAASGRRAVPTAFAAQSLLSLGRRGEPFRFSASLRPSALPLAAPVRIGRMQPAYGLHLPGSRLVSATAMNMAAVDVTALEAQVAEQGDKVRKMKEAMKADANSHTKEELTAEVDKLKILKAKLSPAGTVERGSGGSGGGRASAAVIQDKEKSSNKSDKAEKLDLQPPKGTRDFYPEDMRMRNWLFGQV